MGGVGVTNDISGVAVAYGGGGGGGGGDSGATPASPGTDGGGDGTGYNSGLPGGDGADGRGGGGGGSGWGIIKDGGRGGSGIVILRYAFDASNLATPTVSASSVAPGVESADVVVDVVSFGRNATSLSVVATARPAGGGEAVTQSFPNVPAGTSTLTIRGLSADVAYELSFVATNDRNQSTPTLSAGTVTPVGAYARATGGESFQWKRKRQIHVFTNATDTLVVEKGGFADVLLVGGGGAGGAGVGGGGGGGGAVYRTGVPLAAGTYVVSVGRGGDSNGKNGGDTTFAGFVAFGGGGGGGWGPTAGNPGGSGGGSCGGFAGGAGTPGQGYEGGLSGDRSSSGGGGAGGPGGDGGTATPRPSSAVGGAGFACSITGVEVRYGGGGGGGGGDRGATPASPGTDGGGDGTAYETGLPGGDGADGLGAGGGGSGFGYQGTGRGGYGGCGTVIVAYDLPSPATIILVK